MVGGCHVVGAFGGGLDLVQEEARPIRDLLVIGGCCHDYERQKDILTKGISARANDRPDK